MNEVNFIRAEEPRLPKQFCTCDAIRRCETAIEASDMCRKCKQNIDFHDISFYNAESHMRRTNEQYKKYAEIMRRIINGRKETI